MSLGEYIIHWSGTLHVLSYVKDAPRKGLIYKRSGNLKVEAYSDSGYVGDRGDRKSTSSFGTYVRGNLVT